jgi:mitochondrial chaperone BCS1
MTAEFNEGDPAYDWIVQFLTHERVWKRSRDFRVSASSSQRKWGIKPGNNEVIEGNADYVPTYDKPQLFRWHGHWMEIQRNKIYFTPPNPGDSLPSSSGSIFLT